MRTIPRSRTNPQYNREALPGSLSAFQIAYEHVAELGSRRARTLDIAPDVNAFWENQSFHNYADYAMGRGFRSGLARLRELGRVRRCAVMCAEAVPWRCHRRLLADAAVLLRGAAVEHLFHDGRLDAHRPTAEARVVGRRLVYDGGEPGLPLRDS